MNDEPPKQPRKIIAYGILVSLLLVFGFSAWLAAHAKYLEAISFVGIATTLAWFAARMINSGPDDD